MIVVSYDSLYFCGICSFLISFLISFIWISSLFLLVSLVKGLLILFFPKTVLFICCCSYYCSSFFLNCFFYFIYSCSKVYFFPSANFMLSFFFFFSGFLRCKIRLYISNLSFFLKIIFHAPSSPDYSAMLISTVFWVEKDRIGLLGCIYVGRKVGCSLHAYFLLWKKSQAKGISLDIEICCLREGAMLVQWNCSSYPL